jgi:chaperonin GroES
MSNLRPLADRIVVKKFEQEVKSPSGLYIPPASADKPDQGEVIAVGPGKIVNGELKPLEIQIGDHVLYGTHSGQAVKISGHELLVMREDDVMAVLQK